jgi:hypothetical protein
MVWVGGETGSQGVAASKNSITSVSLIISTPM